eukprot:SAG22_NODE_33_length_27588_cov_104.174652_27_plen_85_part_00
MITAFPSVSLPFLAVPLISQRTVAISTYPPAGAAPDNLCPDEQDMNATGCRGCLLRGRGYFSPDGGPCEICPAGRTPNYARSAW